MEKSNLNYQELLSGTLAALALIEDELEFNEAEVEAFLATKPQPTPKTQAALEALGPDLVQRIMTGAREPKWFAGFVRDVQTIISDVNLRAKGFWGGFTTRILTFAEISESSLPDSPALQHVLPTFRTEPLSKSSPEKHGKPLSENKKPIRLRKCFPEAVLREKLPWAGEFVNVTVKPTKQNPSQRVLIVSVDVHDKNACGGELGVAIKGKSSTGLFVLSKNVPKRTHSQTFENDLNALEWQLYMA